MSKKTEILKAPEVTEESNVPVKANSIFADIRTFENAQRMVMPLVKSNLIPDTFRGNVGDCLIALEYAQRINASPMMVMQNLYVVHGKPAWSSQFLIACINKSGKFSPLRYEMTGTEGKDDYGCIAWAIDKSNGEQLKSPKVTIAMAKSEGWVNKNGSKWKTMPELMLRYRAATMFARLFAPELTMGIQTEDEVIDVAPVVTETRPSKFEKKAAEPVTVTDVEVIPETEQTAPEKAPELSDLEKLQAKIDEKGIPVTAEEVKAYVEKQGDFFAYDMVEPNLDDIVTQILAEGSKE